jgi:hypothetical protein
MKIGHSAAALVLLGSIVYLLIVYLWSSQNASVNPTWWLSSTAVNYSTLWVPLLGGMAVISAIALFFMSIGSIVGVRNAMTPGWTWKLLWWAGFTFIAITGGTPQFIYALVGFALTFIGASMATRGR